MKQLYHMQQEREILNYFFDAEIVVNYYQV